MTDELAVDELAVLLIKQNRQLDLLRQFVQGLTDLGVPLDGTTRELAQAKLDECRSIADSST